MTLFDPLYRDSDRTLYLSVFRVYLCFHLAKDLVFRWTSLDLLYGVDSFVVRTDRLITQVADITLFQEWYVVLIVAHVALLGLFAFGIGKGYTAFGLYVTVKVLQRMHPWILDGGDNLLEFALLYMVFCDSYQHLSVTPLNIQTETKRKVVNLFTNLGTRSIMVHLCLVYFMTGLHKAHADVWYNGTATYYIFQVERFAGTPLNQLIAQSDILVALSTLGTLIWELTFPVLVWTKRLRVPLMLIGMSMHLGIYIFMMINDFQILFISIYGFFFTNDELRAAWSWVTERLRAFRGVRQQTGEQVAAGGGRAAGLASGP